VTATQAAAGFGLRDVLFASRPVSWINTGLPYLAAAFDQVRGLDAAVVLGTLYFLIPYNILLYGVNDLFDYESDIRNPRKQSLEGGLVAPAHRRTLWLWVLVTNVPFLLALGWLGGPVAAVALLLTVAVALAYSAPPLRTKERPFLDSTTSALHFVLPAICGYLVTGRPLDELPWPVLAGFMTWGIASHAIGAIQDIEYDRAAGIGSIATALGGRATAWVSLAGYAFTTVMAFTLPLPWSVISSLALAAYLLLPVMVLLRSDETQARRAWRSFMQLNIPVGFVLANELMHSWGLSTLQPWEIVIGATTVAAGWMLVNVLLTRAATRRRFRGSTVDALPPLTVVVPCRNEARRLPAVLASLVTQRYPGELHVCVVDDGSTDATATVAAAGLEALKERGTVLAAPSAPDGWSGKGWAVACGVQAARTDLVLALDADTELAPDAAEVLVREIQASGADLVSGVTRYAMPTLGERTAMPGYPMLLFGFLPVWASALRGGRPPALAFAYGPLALVRRDAYLATGGHAAIPGTHREDVDLARTLARGHRRIATIHAADIGATRHYASASEIARSWSRILPGYAGWSVAVVLLLIAGELLAWVMPLALPLLALGLDPDHVPATLVPLAMLAAARTALAITQRQPLVTILLHPLTAAVTIGAHVAALGAIVAGRTPAWRGRSMPDPASAINHAPGAQP
jgi:4-hydroxybenzoate polyprenyltransferase/cellulose synthase/poly-beta-1,6-N-acetylglucosamine synthase-like glycosyltransferase